MEDHGDDEIAALTEPVIELDESRAAHRLTAYGRARPQRGMGDEYSQSYAVDADRAGGRVALA